MGALKRVLVVCTKYDVDGDSPWLTNEFSLALKEEGIDVVVCFVDWSSKTNAFETKIVDGVEVLVFPKKSYRHLSFFGKALKWFQASSGAYAVLCRMYDVDAFDAVVSFSPSSTDRGLINKLIKKHQVKSFYVLWDFFPFHHHQIGLVPSGPLYWLAKMVESYMMSFHDVIALMSQANIEYFNNVWPEHESKKKVVFPIWGRSTRSNSLKGWCNKRAENGFSDEDFVFVYGGQLNAGRGVDMIFDAASSVPSNVKFLIIGWGRNYDSYKRLSEEYSNIIVLPAVSRGEYKELIGSCDCGLVLTDSKTDVPTFPSKTFDYFDVGLPILAHVEESTDYGKIISDEAKAGLWSAGDDVNSFLMNIRLMSEDKARSTAWGDNGYQYLMNELQVSKAVERFVKALDDGEGS